MAYYTALFNSSEALDEEVINRIELVGKAFEATTRYNGFRLSGVEITALGVEGRLKKLVAKGGTDLDKADYQDFIIMGRALLKLIVNFVNSVAAGVKTAVIESGFECSTPRKHGITPKHSAKSSTYAGAIEIYYRPHARCSGVSHQVCYDPPTEDAYLSQRMSLPGKYTWPGLTSGKKVWTRSCFAQAGKQSEWSDPISVYVP
ncbi:MAG: hypothetical protein WCL51_03840 [Bacteroidota bacterium]